MSITWQAHELERIREGRREKEERERGIRGRDGEGGEVDGEKRIKRKKLMDALWMP